MTFEPWSPYMKYFRLMLSG